MTSSWATNVRASLLLGELVPPGVTFRFSATITQRQVSVPLDRRTEVQLQVLDGDRCSVGLPRRGRRAEEISLATVDDLEAAPPRFG